MIKKFKDVAPGQRFHIQVFWFLLVRSFSSAIFELRVDGKVYEVDSAEPVDEKFTPDLIVYIVE